MSLDLHYYFQDLSKFPLPKDFFDGITSPHEILIKIKTTFDEMFPDKGHHIGEGCDIGEFVVIKGPVYIGRGVKIESHALIRPYTVIGDGCAVGHAAELKRCVMFNGAKVASLAFAGDTVMGASSRLGSGVITGNRKFDQSDVTLKLGGARHGLGGDYFGLVLGDSSRLGANCTTQPGTHIGRHTWIFPQTSVRGFIPSGKRVFARTELVCEENEIVELKP